MNARAASGRPRPRVGGGGWGAVGVLLLLLSGGWWSNVDSSNQDRSNYSLPPLSYVGPIALLIAAGVCFAVAIIRLTLDRRRHRSLDG